MVLAQSETARLRLECCCAAATKSKSNPLEVGRRPETEPVSDKGQPGESDHAEHHRAALVDHDEGCTVSTALARCSCLTGDQNLLAALL